MDSLWQGLSEVTVPDILEKALKTPFTNLALKRNSYINRVFEVESQKGERLIAKFYRPGRWSASQIKEEHAFLNALAKAELPVIEPLQFNDKTLFEQHHFLFCLYPKKWGRSLDEFNESTWQQLGRLLGRVHVEGQHHKNSDRIKWTPAIATEVHLAQILDYEVLPAGFEKPLEQVVRHLIHHFSAHFEHLDYFLIHGDCHRSNIISREGEGLFLIDFDDMCVGPAVQDLWMFLPDTLDKSCQELEWFLEGYETFRQFNHAELKLIPALQAMRQIHYAAWCAVQSKDPDFAEHFPHFGTPSYWNELLRDLQKLIN